MFSLRKSECFKPSSGTGLSKRKLVTSPLRLNQSQPVNRCAIQAAASPGTLVKSNLLDYATIFESFLYQGNNMNDEQENTMKVKQKLTEIDSQMKTSLGADTTLRQHQYRQRSALERKFMKQIVEVASDLLGEMDQKQVMEIIGKTVLLSHAETETIKHWLADEDEGFISGVIPCVVMIENKKLDKGIQKPFVTSLDEYKEFAQNFPKYDDKVSLWAICQLYDLKDYVLRDLGTVLNEEIRTMIDNTQSKARSSANQYLFYSSTGKIWGITEPHFVATFPATPNQSGKNMLYIRFMGIPFAIFGKRKLVLKTSDDLEVVSDNTLEWISRFMSKKLKAEIIVMDPVFDDELPEFLEAMADENARISDSLYQKKHVAHVNFPIEKGSILPPPENIREACLNFFYLSSIKCSECEKIHEDDAKITGIKDNEQWNLVIDEYLLFLLEKKDSVLSLLAKDEEIIKEWPEMSDMIPGPFE